MQNRIIYKDLGLIDYKDAWDYQESVLEKMVRHRVDPPGLQSDDMIAGHLLFCEHPHVYTIGKSGSENNLLIHKDQLRARGASYYRINRGGDITYHGPGQIVGYPIFDLSKLALGPKKYIYLLEEAVIRTLNDHGLKGERLDGAIGVWLDVSDPSRARKICAIGVRVSRQVTMHGFAFNISTDLDFFRYINPCGFVDKGVTSMDKEIIQEVDFSTVKLNLKQQIINVFQVDLAD